MERNLSGKNGVAIQILTKKLSSEKRKNNTSKVRNNAKTRKKPKIKKDYSFRKLKTSDLKNIHMGIYVLERIINESLDIKDNEFLKGEQDVSRLQKELLNYRYVMDDFIKRIRHGIGNEFEIQTKVNNLSKHYEILQATRDGIILKQEEREEIIDGERKTIRYDTPMTNREVRDILSEYEDKKDDISYQKLENYLGLGLGFAGMLGSIVKNNLNKDVSSKGDVSIVSIGTMIIGSLRLLEGVVKSSDRIKRFELDDKEDRLVSEFLEHEQISDNAKEGEIKNIQKLSKEERKLNRKIENKGVAFKVILDLAVALISGMYVNKNIQIKENGKIDGKTLASTLVSLENIKGIAENFVRGIEGVVNIKKDEERFKELCQKVNEILEQMEEKVYPLQGASHSFNSISIKNLKGKFYPKKDYETGKTEYSTIINIPEFSMKRGDVVLLSGESGAGKSTFLRLLKRGDINNRKAIKLDDEENVDSLGKEYISFRPNMNLGDETNVLYQIIGKKNTKDLTKQEERRLLSILRKMKFDSPNLIQQLSEKKFMEFSTGQQKRLALSKLFYRIKDGKSVIIVDEPVGNVEDNLIREQLKMIKRYAQSRNVMLILTTHRLDLAEDLATKRYHINKEGTLEQIPVKPGKEEEQDLQI